MQLNGKREKSNFIFRLLVQEPTSPFPYDIVIALCVCVCVCVCVCACVYVCVFGTVSKCLSPSLSEALG